MKVFSIAKGSHRLTKHAPPNLSQRDLDKLRALTIYKETYDVPLVCKTFGISKSTLYRWLGRFDPKDLSTLRDRSRRPKKLRSPLWPSTLVLAVK
ncbi:MAG: helix-turn-helix domain-containing protein, partial [Nitrospirae bacterium]|nr:helix-turn-helix domain-containing protein [Nitrospirota bacterium]